jgi:sugar-specific transcriptional regulator TrmB
MNSQTSLYYTAQDVMEIMGVSKTSAYRIIKSLNDELEAKGYLVTMGKVPKKYLAEKCYGLEVS